MGAASVVQVDDDMSASICFSVQWPMRTNHCSFRKHMQTRKHLLHIKNTRAALTKPARNKYTNAMQRPKIVLFSLQSWTALSSKHFSAACVSGFCVVSVFAHFSHNCIHVFVCVVRVCSARPKMCCKIHVEVF